MKVEYIRSAKSQGYIIVGVATDSDKMKLTVSESDYRCAGEPKNGDNLTRDAYKILYISDMTYRARVGALRILTFGDNSEKMLYLKLCRRGIEKSVAKKVAMEMVGRGYVNDQKQIDRLIESAVNVSNLGPAKIVPKLIAKGYSRADIENAIEELEESGRINFEEAKARLLASKTQDDSSDENIKKILYKNGFYSIC